MVHDIDFVCLLSIDSSVIHHQGSSTLRFWIELNTKVGHHQLNEARDCLNGQNLGLLYTDLKLEIGITPHEAQRTLMFDQLPFYTLDVDKQS